MTNINLPCIATKCDVAAATSIAITSTENRIISTISRNKRNIYFNKNIVSRNNTIRLIWKDIQI